MLFDAEMVLLSMLILKVLSACPKPSVSLPTSETQFDKKSNHESLVVSVWVVVVTFVVLLTCG